ncbi:hypothetical protein GWK47_028298 [Chionoecetes opilio]|uniref:Uncharacterized protein n=1 Tax=Chionoecetes opilio TaxID=41210 RepID=A0A8J4YM58_CHIOP|nr:hypothetical protein GWK47_028298 [Chionoecetes opilio]
MGPRSRPPDDQWNKPPVNRLTSNRGGNGAPVNRTEEEGGGPPKDPPQRAGEVHLEGTQKKREGKGPGGQEAGGGSPPNPRRWARVGQHSFPVGATGIILDYHRIRRGHRGEGSRRGDLRRLGGGGKGTQN